MIPNGFDTDAFRPDETARRRVRAELELPADALLIGLVARVHPVKDHVNFLRAAGLFVTTCQQAHFVLVGDGAEAKNPALSGLISELNLRSRVHLCGPRSDIAAIDAALDIASSSSGSSSPDG